MIDRACLMLNAKSGQELEEMVSAGKVEHATSSWAQWECGAIEAASGQCPCAGGTLAAQEQGGRTGKQGRPSNVLIALSVSAPAGTVCRAHACNAGPGTFLPDFSCAGRSVSDTNHIQTAQRSKCV